MVTKKRSIILGLMVAVSLLLAIGCDGGGGGDDPVVNPVEPTETVYAIGDIGPSGVGIVFYITDGGLHGLEAAPSDQGTSEEWIVGGSTLGTENGNTGTAIGTGMANSNANISQTGHTGSAAQVCRDYNGGGLTDWFLPSKDELNELYTQRDVVGGFANDDYLSSSEYSAYYAWYQDFSDGGRSHCNKEYDLSRVRAVRAF